MGDFTLAASATAIVVAASVATGGCSATSPGTTTGLQQDAICTSADAMICPTGVGALQLCVTAEGPKCVAAYMKVGLQKFMCNSCDDTSACNNLAAAYCYGDAGPATN